MHRFKLHLVNGLSYDVSIDIDGNQTNAIGLLREWKRDGFLPLFEVNDDTLRLHHDGDAVTGVVIDASTIIAIEVMTS